MFGLKKNISLICAGLLLLMPIWISSAKADDSEIYNATTDTGAAGDVNLIFMIDNSGSMEDCISSSESCKSNASSRMASLRKAMSTVITQLQDTTKVAIFTFGRKNSNSDGATMLAPLRALNEKMPDGTTTHEQFLLDWFVAKNQIGDNQYLIGNHPPNWKYNFGPTDNSYLNTNPPANCATSLNNTNCRRSWDNGESNLRLENNTPLESAYAEIGAYLLGKEASKWGVTYFARTGTLVQMSALTETTGSGYFATTNTYWSKLESELSVISTSAAPLVYTDSKYYYRKPSYTVQQTCVAPVWHIILVTDGQPTEDDNRQMFATVIPNAQRKCDHSKSWECSQEMALFLANKTVPAVQKAWTCGTNCDAYYDTNSNLQTPVAPTDLSSCRSATSSITTDITVKRSYEWECQASGRRGQSWECISASTGASCGNSNKPQPSSSGCDSSGERGNTERTFGSNTTAQVTWQCQVAKDPIVYNNGLAVNGASVTINTDAIFVGPEGTTVQSNLEKVTRNGGGIFKTATTVNDLVNALLSTVKPVEKLPNTVSAPGVAVNQLSRFQHLNQLYYSVFQPAAKGMWEGNLKRYVLEDNTIKDAKKEDAVSSATKFFSIGASSCWGSTESAIKQPAGCMGYTGNDGNKTPLGGMRSKLDPSNRNILTTTNGTDVVTLESLRLAGGSASGTVSTSAAYMGYSTACTSVGAKQYCNGALGTLGADNANQITNFNKNIDWAKGVRDNETIDDMLAGDPLHSQPVLVNYGFTGDNLSGDARQTAYDAALADGALQENYVFFSTNAGVLHGIDANTGAEKFSFIPKETLPLIPKTVMPDGVPTWTGTASRLYGLDSTWVPWRRDANNDGDIKDGSTEWAYIFGGMRMGGSNYYALNVTNIASPSILWTIKGPLAGGFNTVNDNGQTIYQPIKVASVPTDAYSWMGQTWSKPVLARIALSNGANEEGRTVLIFGGGYDPTNETQPYKSGTTTVTPASTFGTDAYGHQLYIVDAKTGNLLYWASGGDGAYGSGTVSGELPTATIADMKYSITGSPTPVDRNGDGFTDLIYFADLGGQVFRMDLRNKGTNNGTATTCASTITSTCGNMVIRVAKIASLGEAASTSSIADQRRFFEAAGIGILQRPGGSQYMGVTIGSGNRSHPAFVGTQDRVYVFEDSTALTPNLGGSVTVSSLTHANLEDVTSYTYNTSSLATFTGKKGFYINLTATSGTGADGEKIFSTPLIFQGLVYLTSYVPEAGASTTASNQCSPGTGSSSLYIFNVFDGRAAKHDADDLLDRAVEGITSTITGDVQIVFNSDGTSTILAGTYAQDAGSSNKGLRRTRWYENPHY